ncbi:GGDEF domain-containing protein [Acinetobacter rathckeae]|uniref:GGDEF domain-containing protein n=1 Tax=Acinetobacter rathckeae TaxID=2605272 RepID=UPI0018A2F752|nr:diguanylate cyclase [Acinetobacter rathckeae]MBF7688923.1 diguanylate cyclase [Acinetobacter rathckeae]MBF7696322.1 diguanylate cyclase [Acinetobacter rathckeae]
MHAHLSRPLKFTYYVYLLSLLCLLGLVLFLTFGQIKHLAQWNWVDILGEGGSTIFIGLWIALLLKGRPQGRVTNYIFFGLSFIFFHLWIDTLDEFIRLPKTIHWNAWLESVPFPIGIGLLTIGLMYWKQEQLAISKQLLKTERIFRDHRLFDALTPLADANYFKAQLNTLIDNSKDNAPHCVILIDMQQFDAINKKYGFDEGSLILQYISQTLILNLRSDDLVCRLAGDRFVILLPQTRLKQAEKMTLQLKKLVATCQYYPQHSAQAIELAVHAICSEIDQANAHLVLKHLNQKLQHTKQNDPIHQVVLQ